ncbi:arginase family protein [Vitiosangium sp. GDMCC 1.1324]|uniref:arginase family protein n=1 Tax=Vitiosangium sp. (strain GDMCC 1.1324) TaxID=2138576 RepID=UPI00130EB56A|nr:arginase family protein [Vitiosangium sp. GDMCC 1.1324]
MLFLYFPQWQGSGTSDELYRGAALVRQRWPELPWVEVPVERETPLPIRHGILGYDALLAQQQAAAALLAHHEPTRLVTLGGDCGVELAPVSWLNRCYAGNLAVLWLDAHGDLNTPQSSPSGHFHGMPLRCLLGEGEPALTRLVASRLDPRQVLLAGARELDPPEADFITARRMARLTASRLNDDPASLARWVGEAGFRHVYVHLDLDVLEPSGFPHVKCPTPGGVTPEALVAALSRLREDGRLVGMSVLEFVPGEGEAGLDLIDRLLRAALGEALGPATH